GARADGADGGRGVRPARDARRPRMLKTLELRADALRRLHEHQVRLLKEWRGHQAADRRKQAEELLPTLLLSINAIASGLRTTG
ncbi:MAG: phosphoenolpyruvate carboxylase, partial [Thermoanaerobaculia bacterium]|nr:phosphoenolpyruvate carboxylase [Thermoanaerobaculia bacterium]